MRRASLIIGKTFSFAILFAAFVASAFGATITVNSTSDNGTNGCNAAECTLREAIAASQPGDTIGFASPLFDSPQTITLTQGELAITLNASVTINGTGANRLSISGNNASRVFFVGPQATLTLNNLTVTGGKTDGNNGNAGAGIYNNGTTTINNSNVSGNSSPLGPGITNSTGMLTVNNSIISGNSAPGGAGGGIFNDLGTVTISNSTVSGNSAVGNGTNSSIIGGGIYNNSGNVTITNSTISGNFVNNGAGGSGGGIFNASGMITLTNSTVSGNSVSGEDGGIGGGIYNGGEMTLTNSTVNGNTAGTLGGGIFNAPNSSFLSVTNSTISGNTASSGGGIFNGVEGTLTLTSVTVAFNTTTGNGGGVYTASGINLFNTIVAKNNGPASAPDFSGEISSHSSFNLIGNGTGMNGITNSGGNKVGTSANPIDPVLGALANNGGATQTHALLPGSPAIDQGDDTGTDQRGFTRPVDLLSVPNAAGGNAADIGAYELQNQTTAASVNVGGRAIAGKRGISNVRITLIDSNGNARTAITNSFGYYRFADVIAGYTYTITATAKRFAFVQPVQILSLADETDNINFVAENPFTN